MANDELLEEESSIISLTDEEGNEVEFELLDSVDYEGKEYLILLPPDDDDAAAEVLILEVEPQDNDMETYVTVNDDETLTAVFEIFKERFKDIFTFES